MKVHWGTGGFSPVDRPSEPLNYFRLFSLTHTTIGGVEMAGSRNEPVPVVPNTLTIF
jgi:hypothetical protein